LEQPDLLIHLVQQLVQHLSIPLSVKVRLLPRSENGSIQNSLDLYQQLVDAGCHMLTIHGRTRLEKDPWTGPADWPAIAQVVKQLGHRIPILANGSMSNRSEIQNCLQTTRCDGVMCSEAILEYPALFYNSRIGRLTLAREYLQLAHRYPPQVGGQGSGLKCMRIHLHRILDAELQNDPVLRQKVIDAECLDDLVEACNYVEQLYQEQNHDIHEEELSWYMRHRAIVNDTMTMSQYRQEKDATVKSVELVDDAALDLLFG